MNIHYPKKVEKPWGYELWIHNSPRYCGKLLVFPEKGNAFSMHYHMKKSETWYVTEGRFKFEFIDTISGAPGEMIIRKGECVDVEKGCPHRLTALEDGCTIFEVSTEHFNDDSHKIWFNEKEG